MIFLSSASVYFLCMVTFNGYQSIRFVAERAEACKVLGAKYTYVQMYDPKKRFDMERLGNICADRCEHVR